MDSNDLDIGRLQQFASMLQQSTALSSSSPHEAHSPSKHRPLDPEYLRIFRSLLPFLDFSFQKQFGIMLKLMELQYTMDYYQKEPDPGECDPDPPEQKPYRMLQSVRDACDPDKRSFLDMMLNAMRVQEIMHQTQATAHEEACDDTHTDDITAQLKQDLTPEQRGMFDMLSSMLGSNSIS